MKVALRYMGPKKTLSGSFITMVLLWTRTGARLYFRQRSGVFCQGRFNVGIYTFFKLNSDLGADHVFHAVFGISDILFHYIYIF